MQVNKGGRGKPRTSQQLSGYTQ